MPLHNLGTLVLGHVVFLVHVVYLHIAFSHASHTDLFYLYCITKLFARQADDIVDVIPPTWPPRALVW